MEKQANHIKINIYGFHDRFKNYIYGLPLLNGERIEHKLDDISDIVRVIEVYSTVLRQCGYDNNELRLGINNFIESVLLPSIKSNNWHVFISTNCKLCVANLSAGHIIFAISF